MVSRNYDRKTVGRGMERAESKDNRTPALPSGAGVFVAASLGALFWLGAFALFW